MNKFSMISESNSPIVQIGVEKLNSELLFLVENNRQVGSLIIVYNENNEQASIFSVEVLNSHRGKGYGKKLVLESLNRVKSRGIKKMELNTEVDNVVANKLYESLGFELMGLKDDFNNYILYI